MLSAMADSVSPPVTDRRVQRTRAAIVSAFTRLVLEQGYAALSPADVAAAADIGRSTFYEHFRGLDDLLGRSVGTLMAPLAAGCLQAQPGEAMRQTVAHIWKNRRLAHELFKDETQPILLRSHAATFEAALSAALAASGGPAMLAPNLIALMLAASQLALLRAWISGRSDHSADGIAEAMHAAGHATVTALLRPPAAGSGR